MRLDGRIEPGRGAKHFTGQPHCLAYSGLSPELYFILGADLRAALVCAAKTAAFLVAVVVAAKAASAALRAVSLWASAPGLALLLSVHAARASTTKVSNGAKNVIRGYFKRWYSFKLYSS